MDFKSFKDNVSIKKFENVRTAYFEMTEQLKEQAKQQGIAQLESSFPKITTNARNCGSKGVNVEINGRSFFVQGTPTYIHNINEGTYSLQSIEYTVIENPKGAKTGITGDDYLNNIIENKAVGSDANIQDLQNELNDLVAQLNEKIERLRKLEIAISGKSDLTPIGFEAVDPNSPDAAETLSKQIEEATKKLSELDKQIKEKQDEYYKKCEYLSQEKNRAKQIDQEFDKLKQLYNDLLEHYGFNIDVLANSSIKSMAAPENNDLDSLRSWYKQYMDMQKENIETLNKLIENIKSSDKSGDVEETAVRAIPEDKNEYLQNLKDEANSLDARFEKSKKLYLDLCEHYHIDTTAITMPWVYMSNENPANIDAEIDLYKEYIAMQKENIIKTNEAIDKIVDSDNQPSVNVEELEEIKSAMEKFKPNSLA